MDAPLFYSPEIILPMHLLDAQDSAHCVRVLRMGVGESVRLTDGRGNLYQGRIAAADPARCRVEIMGVPQHLPGRPYALTMAVAPTKSPERYEWFLEKATEVGCDRFVPVECRHSERRVFKGERAGKIVTGAVKQSQSLYHPVVEPLTSFEEVIARPFEGVKLIAHCRPAVEQKRLLKDLVQPGQDALVLIGPEGDFSQAEVAGAVERGFAELSLGESRLRTETAALAVVMQMSFINQ